MKWIDLDYVATMPVWEEDIEVMHPYARTKGAKGRGMTSMPKPAVDPKIYEKNQWHLYHNVACLTRKCNVFISLK